MENVTEMTKKITGKSLYEEYKNGTSMSDVFDNIKKDQFAYPEKPRRPHLPPSHNSEDLKEYTKMFTEYEVRLIKYEEDMILYRERQKVIHEASEEFIKIASGFYDYVPINKQDKVWAKAWEDGHSSGYQSVYHELDELVELFID